MNNRKHNSTNPFQGNTKRVLCVCSAGLLRSPTAAIVLHREFGFNTRAAGLEADFALIPVDDVLIHWADEIVCMNNTQSMKISEAVEAQDTPIINLDIADAFEFMDTELQSLIIAAYRGKTK